MKFTIPLLIPDKPTPNGRIYTGTVLHRAVDEFSKKVGKSLVCVPSERPSLNDVVGVVDGIEYDGRVHVDIRLLDTPNGKKIQELITRGVKIVARAVGRGNVIDGIVSNYSIDCVTLESDND